ncbi:ankyrin repeat domain-containing protein [Pseudomonas sp. abacavir_1]|uniref:ankyrin repeat domain-containing protein n=1 Tax=Pseudomonas citronellolis TaxID=53408 RepID=UPI000E2FCF88|nr:ankyrin repeat domain-containing protein [Pseudomonas citronellolis]
MSVLNDLIEQIYEQAKGGNWAYVMSEWSEEPVLARLCSRYRRPSSGWTFLHQAAYFGHEAACRELIRLGASAARLTAEGKSAVEVSRERGGRELAILLDRSILDERSLWATPSDPDLLPSSNLMQEAVERRATRLMLVAYAGGVVKIPSESRYFADSFGRPLVGWHGTFDPPCAMDGESMLRA